MRYSFPRKYGSRWKLCVLLKRYEPETTRVIERELRRGITFIGIGAHIGYFTRLAARRVSASDRVIAFETDRENLRCLRKTPPDYYRCGVSGSSV